MMSSAALVDLRNKRMNCLFMLREARQYHFGEIHAWELQIMEINHLLELYPTLPRQIRELNRSNRGFWLAQLSLIYSDRIRDISILDDPTKFKMLLEAEKYCQQSLLELKHNFSNAGQIAIQHRNMAPNLPPEDPMASKMLGRSYTR
jgi:hypothetical protein